MLTEEQTKDLEFCRDLLLDDIKKTVAESEAIKAKLTSEVLISLVYLKIFSAFMQEKGEFTSIEESWKFMNDIKTVIEKVYYVQHYIVRFKESLEEQKKTQEKR